MKIAADQQFLKYPKQSISISECKSEIKVNGLQKGSIAARIQMYTSQKLSWMGYKKGQLLLEYKIMSEYKVNT